MDSFFADIDGGSIGRGSEETSLASEQKVINFLVLFVNMCLDIAIIFVIFIINISILSY